MADDKTLETGVDKDAVQIERVREEVDAQVAPAREPDADKVEIHETRVSTDVVITDPTSPLAVQVPDEVARELPIHSLDAPSAEQVFEGSEPGEKQAAEKDPTGPLTADESGSEKSDKS